MTDILMTGQRNFPKKDVGKSFRGKAKTVTRVLGNDAYFYLCRSGAPAKQKQPRRFLAVFGTNSR